MLYERRPPCFLIFRLTAPLAFAAPTLYPERVLREKHQGRGQSVKAPAPFSGGDARSMVDLLWFQKNARLRFFMYEEIHWERTPFACY